MIDIQIGDKVTLEPLYNMGIATKGPVTGIVQKIGRKYVHIKPTNCCCPYRFDRETGECVGEGGMSPQWILYLSRQAYDDAIEAREIAREICKKFKWPQMAAKRIPLENLRKILLLAKEAMQ